VFSLNEKQLFYFCFERTKFLKRINKICKNISIQKKITMKLGHGRYCKDRLNHLVSLSSSFIVKRSILIGRGEVKCKLCKSDAKRNSYRHLYYNICNLWIHRSIDTTLMMFFPHNVDRFLLKYMLWTVTKMVFLAQFYFIEKHYLVINKWGSFMLFGMWINLIILQNF